MNAEERSTEDLIVALAADAAPVTPLDPVGAREARWLVLAVAASVALAWAFGFRNRIETVATAPVFLTIAAMSVFVALAASVAALRLSVPDASRPSVGVLTTSLVFGWAGLVGGLALGSGSSLMALARLPWHWPCVSRVTLLAVVPSAALLIAVSRGYVVEHARATFLAVAAGGALAAGALQFVCPIDRPDHILISHVVPVVALALVLSFVSSRK